MAAAKWASEQVRRRASSRCCIPQLPAAARPGLSVSRPRSAARFALLSSAAGNRAGNGLLPGIGRVNRAIAICDAEVWTVGDGESLHWDGTRWRHVPTAALHDNDSRAQLFGLAQFGSADVWAAGYAPRRDHSGSRGTVQRWDGAVWTDLPVPDVATAWSLAGIGGAAPDDLWAVGRGQPGQSVALHWDGQHWQQMPVPVPDSGTAKLCDVAALASNDVWAAGYRTAPNGGVSTRRPLTAVHWDGSAWSPGDMPAAPGQKSCSWSRTTRASGWHRLLPRQHSHRRQDDRLQPLAVPTRPVTTSRGSARIPTLRRRHPAERKPARCRRHSHTPGHRATIRRSPPQLKPADSPRECARARARPARFHGPLQQDRAAVNPEVHRARARGWASTRNPPEPGSRVEHAQPLAPRSSPQRGGRFPGTQLASAVCRRSPGSLARRP